MEEAMLAMLNNSNAADNLAPKQDVSRLSVRLADPGEKMVAAIFSDDTPAKSDFLSGLICSNGLEEAWGKLSKRVSLLENSYRKMWEVASPDRMKHHFVCREEYALQVEDFQHRQLADHDQLKSLDGRALFLETTLHQFGEGLEETNKRIDCQGDALKMGLQRIDDMMSRTNSTLEEMKRFHDRLMTDNKEHQAALDKAVAAVQEKQKSEEEERRFFAQELADMREYLVSEQMQENLRQISREMLKDYVSWKDSVDLAQQIHGKVENDFFDPLRSVVDGHSQKLKELNEKDLSIEEALAETNDRIKGADDSIRREIKDIMKEVELRLTKVEMKDYDERYQQLFAQVYKEHDAFKSLIADKFQTVAERLATHQDMLEDHEHVLIHHAEELLNRSTKYDMVVLSQRVDKCAVAARVEIDMADIRKTVTWQTAKIEQLNFENDFSGGLGGAIQFTDEEDDAAEPAGDATPGSPRESLHSDKEEALPTQAASPVPTPVAAPVAGVLAAPVATPAGDEPKSGSCTPRIARSASRDSAHSWTTVRGRLAAGSFSKRASRRMFPGMHHSGSGVTHATFDEHGVHGDHYSVIQQQLEVLAQGALCISHLALQKPKLGESRMKRRNMELLLIEHMSKALFWISHHVVPKDWSPVQLASLALQVQTRSPDREDLPRKLSPEQARASPPPSEVPSRKQTTETDLVQLLCQLDPKKANALRVQDRQTLEATDPSHGRSPSPRPESAAMGRQYSGGDVVRIPIRPSPPSSGSVENKAIFKRTTVAGALSATPTSGRRRLSPQLTNLDVPSAPDMPSALGVQIPIQRRQRQLQQDSTADSSTKKKSAWQSRSTATAEATMSSKGRSLLSSTSAAEPYSVDQDSEPDLSAWRDEHNISTEGEPKSPKSPTPRSLVPLSLPSLTSS